MSRVILSALLALAVSCTGCATVLSGSAGTVRVTSSPPGALVTLGGSSYQTPVAIPLSTKQPYLMTIRQDGYLSVRRAVCQVGNILTEGNLLVGGIIGLSADQASGAAFLLYPTAVHAELSATSPTERTYNRSQ